jgi:hypothetical protein
MGPFGWLPDMQCYHGVISLDHGLRGTLVLDGQAIAWDGGRGYIEKDWGAAFPAAWVWMQTNHFSQAGVSLTASVAIIPRPRFSFRGQIVGLWHEGRLYRFATYTGARIERLEADREHVTWVLRGRTPLGGPLCRLELEARRAAGAGLIRGPSTRDMGVRVAESLSAHVAVRLSRLRGGREERIFEDVGRYAGLEVEGDLQRLLGG